MNPFCQSPCRARSAGHKLLTGCDTRVRLVVALAGILAVVLSTRLGFALSVLGLCGLGLAACRVTARSLMPRWIGPAAWALVVCMTQMLMTGHTPLVTLDLGPWQLTATREGFREGVLIASRVLASFAILLVSCQGLTAEELLAALCWARMPRTWIEIAVLMVRYLHLFEEQAVRIAAAQKARLGYGGWRRSFQSMGNLAGLVVLESLDQAERTHEAMLARGYQGHLPLPALPALARRQKAVAAAGVLLVIIAYFLAERWPL